MTLASAEKDTSSEADSDLSSMITPRTQQVCARHPRKSMRICLSNPQEPSFSVHQNTHVHLETPPTEFDPYVFTGQMSRMRQTDIETAHASYIACAVVAFLAFIIVAVICEVTMLYTSMSK